MQQWCNYQSGLILENLEIRPIIMVVLSKNWACPNTGTKTLDLNFDLVCQWILGTSLQLDLDLPMILKLAQSLELYS